MKINCYVIDDLPSIIRQIKKYTDQTPLSHFIGGNTDPQLALNEILNGIIDPDVIFLDIEMPGVSGIDILEPLSKKALVFLLSGFKEYGQEAFERGASGYLYKPLKLEKFQSAIDLSFKLISSKTAMRKSEPAQYYYLPGDGREVRIRLKAEEIIYVESNSNFSSIHLVDNSYHLCSLNLKQLSEIMLPPYFIRINRSILINVSRLLRYDAHDVYLDNGKEFPFGDKYRTEFIDLIRQHGMLY